MQGEEAIRIEVFNSDHDGGRFGQCFNLGGLCPQTGDNIRKHNCELDARLFEVAPALGCLLWMALTKGQVAIRPGLFL